MTKTRRKLYKSTSTKNKVTKRKRLGNLKQKGGSFTGGFLLLMNLVANGKLFDNGNALTPLNANESSNAFNAVATNLTTNLTPQQTGFKNEDFNTDSYLTTANGKIVAANKTFSNATDTTLNLLQCAPEDNTDPIVIAIVPPPTENKPKVLFFSEVANTTTSNREGKIQRSFYNISPEGVVDKTRVVPINQLSNYKVPKGFKVAVTDFNSSTIEDPNITAENLTFQVNKSKTQIKNEKVAAQVTAAANASFGNDPKNDPVLKGLVQEAEARLPRTKVPLPVGKPPPPKPETSRTTNTQGSPPKLAPPTTTSTTNTQAIPPPPKINEFKPTATVAGVAGLTALGLGAAVVAKQKQRETDAEALIAKEEEKRSAATQAQLEKERLRQELEKQNQTVAEAAARNKPKTNTTTVGVKTAEQVAKDKEDERIKINTYYKKKIVKNKLDDKDVVPPLIPSPEELKKIIADNNLLDNEEIKTDLEQIEITYKKINVDNKDLLEKVPDKDNSLTPEQQLVVPVLTDYLKEIVTEYFENVETLKKTLKNLGVEIATQLNTTQINADAERETGLPAASPQLMPVHNFTNSQLEFLDEPNKVVLNKQNLFKANIPNADIIVKKITESYSKLQEKYRASSNNPKPNKNEYLLVKNYILSLEENDELVKQFKQGMDEFDAIVTKYISENLNEYENNFFDTDGQYQLDQIRNIKDKSIIKDAVEVYNQLISEYKKIINFFSKDSKYNLVLSNPLLKKLYFIKLKGKENHINDVFHDIQQFYDIINPKPPVAPVAPLPETLQPVLAKPLAIEGLHRASIKREHDISPYNQIKKIKTEIETSVAELLTEKKPESTKQTRQLQLTGPDATFNSESEKKYIESDGKFQANQLVLLKGHKQEEDMARKLLEFMQKYYSKLKLNLSKLNEKPGQQLQLQVYKKPPPKLKAANFDVRQFKKGIDLYNNLIEVTTAPEKVLLQKEQEEVPTVEVAAPIAPVNKLPPPVVLPKPIFATFESKSELNYIDTEGNYQEQYFTALKKSKIITPTPSQLLEKARTLRELKEIYSKWINDIREKDKNFLNNDFLKKQKLLENDPTVIRFKQLIKEFDQNITNALAPGKVLPEAEAPVAEAPVAKAPVAKAPVAEAAAQVTIKQVTDTDYIDLGALPAKDADYIDPGTLQNDEPVYITAEAASTVIPPAYATAEEVKQLRKDNLPTPTATVEAASIPAVPAALYGSIPVANAGIEINKPTQTQVKESETAFINKPAVAPNKPPLYAVANAPQFIGEFVPCDAPPPRNVKILDVSNTKRFDEANFSTVGGKKKRKTKHMKKSKSKSKSTNKSKTKKK